MLEIAVKYLFVILSVLLMGCSYNPTDVNIEIDSSFSSEKRQLILQALEEWSSKTGGGFGISNISYVDNLSLDMDYNCIKFVNVNINVDSSIKGLVEEGYTTMLWSSFDHPTYHVQATIRIWDQEETSVFSKTVLHEMGHALNLGHYCSEALAQQSWTDCQVVSPDPEISIMSPLVGEATEVEPIDVYRFCSLWECPK